MGSVQDQITSNKKCKKSMKKSNMRSQVDEEDMNMRQKLGIPHNLPIRQIYFFEPLKCYTLDPSVLPIEGMSYIPNFLTKKEHDQLWDSIHSRPFCRIIHRRQQFYGPTYYHTTPNISSLQPINGGEKDLSASDAMASGASADSVSTNEATFDINLLQHINEKLIDMGLFTRDKPPTQVLVNEYVADCGISNHFDDSDAFGDTIVTISLGKPVWMKLQMPSELTNHDQNVLKETMLLLEAGSLFVMQKDVRYRWRHGIPKSRWIQLPDNSFHKRNKDWVRVSLTFRRLKEGRKKVEHDSTDWVDIAERKPYDSVYDYQNLTS